MAPLSSILRTHLEIFDSKNLFIIFINKYKCYEKNSCVPSSNRL